MNEKWRQRPERRQRGSVREGKKEGGEEDNRQETREEQCMLERAAKNLQSKSCSVM